MVDVNLVLPGDRNTCVFAGSEDNERWFIFSGLLRVETSAHSGLEICCVFLLSEKCSISRKGVHLFGCILRQSEYISLRSSDF